MGNPFFLSLVVTIPAAYPYLSMIQTITCDSGTQGWRTTLQENYSNSFEQFVGYCETFEIADRLGYESPEAAWESNPMIQGSTDPLDLRIVSVVIDGKTYELVPVFDDEDEDKVDYFDIFGPDGFCISDGAPFFDVPKYHNITELIDQRR